MSSHTLDELESPLLSLLKQAIARRVFPGAVVGVVKTNGERLVLPVGSYRYDHTALPMTDHSIFDVASITKTIPTSLLALQLVDRGVLALTDQVVEYLPELAISQRNQLQLWHLLTHTVEFQFAMSELKELSAEKIREKILTTELARPPGTSFAYVNATSILLGWMIEQVTGQSLSELAHVELFEPLKLNTTTFFPENLERERIVPTEVDNWRGRELKGEVHDESAWKLRDSVTRTAVGSAGLFSTAGELLTVLEMILNHGTLFKHQFFSPGMVDQMSTNQLLQLSEASGLGWELHQAWMGNNASQRTIGKTGFTGCAVVADVERGLGLVLLSNAVHPHRPTSRDTITAVRVEVADLVWKLGL